MNIRTLYYRTATIKSQIKKGSNTLSVAEATAVASKCYPMIPKGVIEAIILEADGNKTGKVEFHEITAVMTKVQMHSL